MNLLSAEALMLTRDGSAYRMLFSVKLMIVLFIVSMIMLAKAMVIVMMIPMEIKPPVKVRY